LDVLRKPQYRRIASWMTQDLLSIPINYKCKQRYELVHAPEERNQNVGVLPGQIPPELLVFTPHIACLLFVSFSIILW
jgi:hypothetical protein